MGLIWSKLYEREISGKKMKLFETPIFLEMSESVRIAVVDDSGQEQRLESVFKEPKVFRSENIIGLIIELNRSEESCFWEFEKIKPGTILHLTVEGRTFEDYAVFIRLDIGIMKDCICWCINNNLETAREASKSAKREVSEQAV